MHGMNGIKTGFLLALLTGLLLLIGYVIGGVGGLTVFLVIAGVMNFSAFWFSDRFALNMAGAREITEDADPRLFAMVNEVANLAGMPMPRLYVIQNDAPNAFATGRSPARAAVAVTTGIRRLLSERELRAVIGHEIAHVKNRDTLTSSIVATVAGAISMISFVLFFFGGQRNAFAALAIMILAPIVASIIRFAISRTREFAADETGARIVHDPEALADALEKLHRGVAMRPMEPTPQQEAVSALYIVHPFRGGGMANLFSTHPPLEERVARLRRMAYGR